MFFKDARHLFWTMFIDKNEKGKIILVFLTPRTKKEDKAQQGPSLRTLVIILPKCLYPGYIDLLKYYIWFEF